MSDSDADAESGQHAYLDTEVYDFDTVISSVVSLDPSIEARRVAEQCPVYLRMKGKHCSPRCHYGLVDQHRGTRKQRFRPTAEAVPREHRRYREGQSYIVQHRSEYQVFRSRCSPSIFSL